MNRFCWLSLVLLTVSCSNGQPRGKRVFFYKNRVALILPDSSLRAAEPHVWGPDCGICDYRVAYHLHKADSTASVGITVRVFPDTLGARWPWKWLFNAQRTKSDFIAKNWGDAVVEKMTVGSVSRTVVIDARLTRPRHPSFIKEITVRRGQHLISFQFLVPDNALMRAAVANSQASIFIDPPYLNGPAESYQAFRNNLSIK